MPSIWDLLPASAWPVQPAIWPRDLMRPRPGSQTMSPQSPAAAAFPFGWAPARATSAPAFAWASASTAPPNASAYSGATDADAFRGAFPYGEIDSARTARLSQDARRAYEFALRAFGTPSLPARELAAGPDVSANRFAPAAAAADVVRAPSRSAEMSGIADADSRPASADVLVPANWADEWDAPVGSGDAASVGAVSQPPAPPMASPDEESFAGTSPERLPAQARYRRAQAGDESFAPQFVRTRPNVADWVLDGLEDDARMAATPPPRLPPNVFIHGDGFYVGRYPDGRLVRWEDADPDAANAYYEEMQKRAELPARTALSVLGGGAGFVERGALGAAGGRLLTGQLHHAISWRVFKALEKHKNLKGFFEHRDPRFVTQAADLPSHNGWWGWHEGFDAEVASYIDTHPDLTPKTFESWLRSRYAKPDLKARFPDGLPRR